MVHLRQLVRVGFILLCLLLVNIVNKQISWQAVEAQSPEQSSAHVLRAGSPDPTPTPTPTSTPPSTDDLVLVPSGDEGMPEEQVIRPGQSVRLLGGRLRVDVPTSAQVHRVRVVPHSVRRLPSGVSGMAMVFDLTAFDRAEKGVTRFDKEPLTVTVRVGPYVNWASRPDWLRPWVGYFDETRREWVEIQPLKVDEAAGLVTFQTDHLSIFGVGTEGRVNSGWVLNFNDTRVSQFPVRSRGITLLIFRPGREVSDPR